MKGGSHRLTRSFSIGRPQPCQVPPVHCCSVPKHCHCAPPSSPGTAASVQAHWTPATPPMQFMQLPVDAHDKSVPFWMLAGQAGIEKLAQTQSPPSSTVGQEQPQGTLAGHGLASGEPASGPASEWALVQAAALVRATVAAMRATRMLRWPSTAEAYQRELVRGSSAIFNAQVAPLDDSEGPSRSMRGDSVRRRFHVSLATIIWRHVPRGDARARLACGALAVTLGVEAADKESLRSNNEEERDHDSHGRWMLHRTRPPSFPGSERLPVRVASRPPERRPSEPPPHPEGGDDLPCARSAIRRARSSVERAWPSSARSSRLRPR
jgi:hypothetical protein